MAGGHELKEDFHPAITFLYRFKGVAAHADVFSESPGGTHICIAIIIGILTNQCRSWKVQICIIFK
jgi:hypothetical protein